MSLFAAASSGGDNGSGGLAWSKGVAFFNIASPLNDLLEKDDFTLEELLQEDELIQEVKSRNKKLIDFLATESVVEQLIVFMTKCPDDIANETRKLKYPFMSCEVICCDIPTITDVLVLGRNGELLQILMQFLLENETLDLRLAGYFEKVLSLLLLRKPKEVTNIINQNAENLREAFACHMKSFSIAEVLKRLLHPSGVDCASDGMDYGMEMGGGMFFDRSMGLTLTNDPNDADYLSASQALDNDVPVPIVWQTESSMVDRLVTCLKPRTTQGTDVDSDVHQHVSDVLVEIIHFGLRQKQIDASATSVADFLEKKEIVDEIIELGIPMNQDPVCHSSLKAGLSVLSALLTRHTNADYCSDQEEEVVPVVISSILSRLDKICQILQQDDAGFITTQYHERRPRLGMQRLKLLDLMVLLVQSKYHAVDEAIAQYNVVSLGLDLMLKFELVNMLHSDVESMVATILESGRRVLQRSLIVDAQLFRRLLDAYAENDTAKTQPKGYVRGYMGYMNKIVSFLAAIWNESQEAETSDDLEASKDRPQLDKLVEIFEDSEAWPAMKEFIENSVPSISERENRSLGGLIPPNHDIENNSMDYGAFSGQDSLLNSQFAEMLESSSFEGDDGDIHTSDLGSRMTELAELPSVEEDSSSSYSSSSGSSGSDDDDFEEFKRRNREDFPPPVPPLEDTLDDSSRAMAAADEAMANDFDDSSGHWANFESSENSIPTLEEPNEDFADFANFEDAQGNDNDNGTAAAAAAAAEDDDDDDDAL